MPTLNEQVITIVANLNRDGGNLDIFMNGDENATYTDTGATVVSSVQKLVADFENRTEYTGVYVGSGTAYTRGQTFNEAYAAYIVTADFVSTTFGADSANYKVSFDLNTIVQAAIDAADAAAVSETNAANSLYSFNGAYLGAQAADPTLDLNGDALTGGEAYWNTTDGELRVYSLDLDSWSAPVTEASDSATAAASSAAAAAAVPAPQLNPKAFAGGVAFDGWRNALFKNIW